MIKYESEDKRIRVEEKDGQKAMFLDGVIQGVCDLEGNPLSPYMVFVKKHLDSLPPKSYTTFLGGGAFILPEYSFNKLNHYAVTYEISDEVVFIASKIHGTIAGAIEIKDAATFDCDPGTEDFIFLDCWNKGFPNALYCPEFVSRCKTALTPKGTFACNYGGTAVEIEAFGKMLASVFPNVKVNLIAMDKDYDKDVQGVFFCS